MIWWVLHILEMVYGFLVSELEVMRLTQYVFFHSMYFKSAEKHLKDFDVTEV